jgi:hypothetical protein
LSTGWCPLRLRKAVLKGEAADRASLASLAD